ncbi:UDP-N-acetylglucosamine--LPS N-acetylglucosamine transferase [Clostridium sp. P21]|uniref:UDP-N-acetylglucosamine--LPS N-acetylglucosamine transferase n=1 Tax=Clostridium muellerianum TaxID=2716538 RepID=A0A7Y0EFM1_9CLOT|nr:glycosyltransferase [Clostridium muellerianum]NMM61570.1 UDP-N-acetylglucosamine--LPS N-acetylglucosamine transferase [Clostridium muellerianum]
MKVLILSVSAGGGHGHAAEALKDYINLKFPESEIKIIDTLKYINPIIDKVVIGSYLKTLKVTPSLYGKLYNHSEGDYGIANTISAKFNEIMTYKLMPLIDELSPNILISTHPFTTEMVSIMKAKYNLTIPAISIITDYYSHGSWLHPYIDAHVVSNKDMVEDMVSKGIPRNTIHDLGIPVKPNFIEKYKKEETLKELDLCTSKFTILVMGGSLGMGKITDVYQELIKVNKDIQIIVITGKNEKLHNELLMLKETSTKPTKIIGFTDTVNKYMQASDLLLTKPGGLTITEALICKIPLGIFSPIPGQEEKNAEFLLNHNLAINLSDTNKCQQTIENLLEFKDKLTVMKANCSKFSKPDSGYKIVELIEYLIKSNNVTGLKNFDKDYYKDNNLKTFFKSVEEYFMKTAIKIFANN